jgi:hypothetical protein
LVLDRRFRAQGRSSLSSSARSQADRRSLGKGVADLCGQCVVCVGSCVCPIRFNERMDLDTLPTTGLVPRRTQYAPRFGVQCDSSIFRLMNEELGARRWEPGFQPRRCDPG